jgi:predicted membrane protein
MFIMLISALEVSECFLLAFELVSAVRTDSSAVKVLLIFDVVLNAGIIFLILYLIGIHIVLKIKGITTYEYIKAQRKKKENKVKPGEDDEKKTLDVKNDNQNKEVKKSIIKGMNKTVLENPCSFSVAKSGSLDLAHMTFQVRVESEQEIQ